LRLIFMNVTCHGKTQRKGRDILKEKVFFPPFLLEEDELRGYNFFCLLIIRLVTSQQPLETSTVAMYSFHIICHINLLLCYKKLCRRYKTYSPGQKRNFYTGPKAVLIQEWLTSKNVWNYSNWSNYVWN
jgi:hypothetical protein